MLDWYYIHILYNALDCSALFYHVCICIFQLARKFYISQWFRDITSETEKAMKSQNENDEDLKGRWHSGDVDSTAEIMQKAETRKKFLRKVIKTSPSHFSSQR